MKQKNFLDYPIRTKLLAAMSLITLLLGISMLVAFLFVYTNVSHQIMTLASKTLDIYTLQIDITLSDLKKQSYATIFMDDFQSDLKVLKKSKDQYEKLVADKHITDRLSLTMTYSDIIDRIDLYSTEGELLNSSSRQIAENYALLENTTQVLDGHGQAVWNIIQSPKGSITMSRLIRTTNNNFTYNPLGIISFYINIEKLTNNRSLSKDFYTNSFVITDNSGNILYNSSEEIVISDITDLNSGSLQRIHGVSYFITKKNSTVTPWNYYLLIPEKESLGSIPFIFRSCGLIFLLLFGTTTFLCTRMAQHITKPLSSLAAQMDLVAHGDFHIDASNLLEYTGRDEIQEICLHFIQMTSQIDRLITENYKVTLLKKESQIKFLQAQMDPHFLYNALDSINWMARLANQPIIASSIQSLSILLRKTTSSREKETTLEKELDLLNHYLNIQKLRFQDRLIFKKEIDPILLDISIPVLILQPIVENSIKYALERMSGPCHIYLKVEKNCGGCRITITDNGPGIPENILENICQTLSYAASPDKGQPADEASPTVSSGLGLKNAADRICLLYNIEHPLTICNNDSCGITVTINLPILDIAGGNPYVPSNSCR